MVWVFWLTMVRCRLYQSTVLVLNIHQCGTVFELLQGYLINSRMQRYSRKSCNDSCFAGFVVIKISTNTNDLLGCTEVCDFYMRETTCKVHGILTCFVAGSCMIVSTITNESEDNMNI